MFGELGVCVAPEKSLICGAAPEFIFTMQEGTVPASVPSVRHNSVPVSS